MVVLNKNLDQWYTAVLANHIYITHRQALLEVE